MIMKKLAYLLETVPEKNGMLFSNVYSQINTVYQGKELKIRFMEASTDSLKPSSGLELRVHVPGESKDQPRIMEFYPMRLKKREWGDFKRFLTGDPQLDASWFILTKNPASADICWNLLNFKSLLSIPGVEQVLLNQNELVVRFKNHHSATKIKQLIDQLVAI
jgi:hypothetical protein